MRYRVYGEVTISCYTVVEADTVEQAIEIAEGRAMCSVGSPESYGGDENEEWFHSGELDGEARYTSVEPE